MTVNDYIKSKFQTFGITISEAELLEMSINGSLTLSENLSTENIEAVSIAIAGLIPSLLLRPQSVSEGGFSQSFDIKALKEYHSFLCNEYGIENKLTGVSDASDCW